MVRFSGPAFVVASLLAAAVLDAQQPAQSPQPAAQPAQTAQPAQPQAPEAPAQPAPDPLYVLDEAFAKGAIVLPSPGVRWPVVLRQVKPTYTPEAMRRKISGDVELRLRVGADGVVEDVRVLRSLDRTNGLDSEAARVARLWLFKPATEAQQAVTALVDITVAFHLG